MGYYSDNHTAALMPGPCKVNPAQAVQVNIQGFINVAEAARLFNVKRLVFASTVGVYAKMDKNHMHPYYESINEDYPKQPHSLYDATRFFCERYGLQMTENYELDFVACRFAHTFGPGKFTHGPMATVVSIVDNSLTGKPVKILKGGEQKVDFIYNRDSGRGLVHACFAENLNYKQFNIGSGKGYKLLDFANIVKKFLPTAEIEIGPGLDFMSFDLYPIYDISRAKNELGFKPVYDLEAAIKDYIEIANRLNYSQEFSGIQQQVGQ